MTLNRPAISAELKRIILVEAGHRCAIPSCRHIDIDVHHIIPWETCKEHKYENLIAICPNCHRRAEKGEIDRKSLRMYKDNLRFLYDRFSLFEIDILYELDRLPPDKSIMLPSYLMLLAKRIIEAGYIDWIKTPAGIVGGGLKLNPDYLKITTKGKDFLKNISSKNIGYNK